MNLYETASIILSENVPRECKNYRNELVCSSVHNLRKTYEESIYEQRKKPLHCIMSYTIRHNTMKWFFSLLIYALLICFSQICSPHMLFSYVNSNYTTSPLSLSFNFFLILIATNSSKIQNKLREILLMIESYPPSLFNHDLKIFILSKHRLEFDIHLQQYLCSLCDEWLIFYNVTIVLFAIKTSLLSVDS